MAEIDRLVNGCPKNPNRHPASMSMPQASMTRVPGKESRAWNWVLLCNWISMDIIFLDISCACVIFVMSYSCILLCSCYLFAIGLEPFLIPPVSLVRFIVSISKNWLAIGWQETLREDHSTGNSPRPGLNLTCKRGSIFAEWRSGFV